MTVLSAANNAAVAIFGKELTALFSNPSTEGLELRYLVNEVAQDMVASHDWRQLLKTQTIVADGAQTVFPTPDDYARMNMASDMHDQVSWFWNYYAMPTIDQWISWKNSGGSWAWPGAWIVIGNDFHFMPAPTQNAEYPYISSHYCRTADGDIKAEFTRDDDTFLLSERVLTLGLIWRYLAQKGLDYSEPLANYEVALAQAQNTDKGARVIRQVGRFRGNTSTPYPWRL